MEKELLKKYKSISKYTSIHEEKEVYQLEQDEIKEIVHDIVNELLTTKKNPKIIIK